MGDRRCLGFLTSGDLQLQAACSSTSSQVHGQQRVRSLSSDLVRGRPRCLLILLGLPSSGVALSNPEVWPGRPGSVGAQFPTLLGWCFPWPEEQGPAGNQEVLTEATSFPPHLSKCCVSESGVETWKMSQAGDTGMAGLGARLMASLLLPLGPGRPARSSPPGCRRWGCPWILFPRSTDTASSSVGRRGPV